MTYLIEPATDEGGHAQAVRMLRQLLGREATVEHTPAGVPYVAELPEIHISISHCRTAVAVAVDTEGAVGIDVEGCRKVSPALVKRVCSPSELAAVEASEEPVMEFLRLWTRKEATLKCRGTGIRGWSSIVAALADGGVEVREVPCTVADTVAAVATMAG